ncbi:MAG: hypothetical protein HYY14_03765 [Candidatus Omnitrophica bacterium]|nr:hypothetical protein [Candidatus Omnitrophota bacterium]
MIRLGAAVLILIFILLGNMSRTRGKAAPPRPPETQAVEAERAGLTKPIPPPREITPEIEAVLARVGRVDPFRVPSADEASPIKVISPGGLVLEGIILDGEERLAIVNNRIVAEGEIVAGRKILKIEDEKIRVDDKGSEIIIRLVPREEERRVPRVRPEQD